MKKALKVLCFMLAGFLVLWFIISIVCGVVTKSVMQNMDISIYGTIAECERLEEFCSADIKIEKYNTPEGDGHIENLTYANFHGAKYSSPDLCFEIFAYEFEDDISARRYYENATGIISTDEKGCIASARFSTFNIVAFNRKNAYTAKCSTKHIETMTNILSNAFSVVLYESR